MTKIIQDYNDIMVNYDPSKYISNNIMTKYERTRIVGLRLEQLARGAPTLIDTKAANCQSIRDIVNQELLQRKIPYILVRTLPNKKKEYFRVCDMIIPMA